MNSLTTEEKFQDPTTKMLGLFRPKTHHPTEWLKTSWRSKELQDLWTSRFTRISLMVHAIESSRQAYITQTESLAKLAEKVFPQLIVPIREVRASSTQAEEPPEDDNKAFKVAVADAEIILPFSNAVRDGNSKAIGEFLEYPQCCSEFFHYYWEKKGLIDLTWPQYFVSRPKVAHWSCNLLWRYFGVRAVFHLPCSNHCQATIELAQKHIRMAQNLGFAEEIDWLEELLKLPVKWSALHGILQITTPLFRISTRTDMTVQEISFERNGFFTAEAMKDAHEKILSFIPEGVNSVVDLGCGDGTLLKRISAAIRVGVDRYDVPDADFDFRHGRIAQFRWDPYDLILISANRFLEMPEWEFESFLAHAKLNAKCMLVYAYEPFARHSINEIYLKILLEGWGVKINGFSTSGTTAITFSNPSFADGFATSGEDLAKALS